MTEFDVFLFLAVLAAGALGLGLIVRAVDRVSDKGLPGRWS